MNRDEGMKQEIRTVFRQDESVVMIDQKALPLSERYVTCTDYREVIAAIKDLTVRGAPAIGVAAAMGIALGVFHLPDSSPEDFRQALRRHLHAVRGRAPDGPESLLGDRADETPV